jgi:diguanylate cyclase (GGDEF)-like protein
MPTVALAAAAIGSAVAIPALIASVFSYGLGFMVLFAYERLPAFAKALIGVGGVLVISTFVLFQDEGALYSLLHVGLIFYMCFFFSPRRALSNVGVVVGLAATAAAVAAPGFREAGEIVVLNTGAFAVTAAITIALRHRLVDALARVQQTSATLDGFFLHAHAGFGVLDSELRHVRVNQALADLMALPRKEIEGKTLREVAPVNADIIEPLAHTVVLSGEPVLGIEVESPNGECHLISYYPLPGVGVGTAVMDVTHLKDVERRLEETNRRLTVLATTDELTGLPNRRLFGEQLDLALARARRGGLAVAILCLDLDRFKEVNDSLGHAYGDRMLVEVANRLRAGARDTDVVARVGGDEFLVMLADLDVQEAPALAETVIERIRGLLADPLPVDAVEIRVDASIGLAIYPTHSRDADGLLAVADAAMYVGKHALTRVA